MVAVKTGDPKLLLFAVVLLCAPLLFFFFLSLTVSHPYCFAFLPAFPLEWMLFCFPFRLTCLLSALFCVVYYLEPLSAFSSENFNHRPGSGLLFSLMELITIFLLPKRLKTPELSRWNIVERLAVDHQVVLETSI